MLLCVGCHHQHAHVTMNDVPTHTCSRHLPSVMGISHEESHMRPSHSVRKIEQVH